ncbi:MAG: bifunctional folylpolyglutamate synthase/dihydrofolate synthase [Lachnospiraceae bacterium]|nr:bifunctional folylpolyglutamate synthase/dihydrofolate synthase [Lachnospiraceae bacterium]
MNITEAMNYIHSLCWMNPDLGLDSTKELLALLGNPEKDLKYVHIGGTNGKGSTSAMTAEILRESGLKVGLFTSPFIMRFNERIMVSTKNGESDSLYGFKEISDDELAELITEVKAAIEKMTRSISEFEAVTALGFLYFKRQACDIVVLEVGMGGEFDATNVISAPCVAALVNIGLDHTKILGETIAEIARTKSGIIKHGSDVVFYGENDEAREEIENRCASEGCTLTIPDFSMLSTKTSDLSGQVFSYKTHKNIKMKMIGEYQQKNAAMSIEIIEALVKRGFKISEKNISAGIEKTSWIARLERINDKPVVFVDGSHNPQGMRATVDAVKYAIKASDKPVGKVICVFGVMADKDHEEIIRILTETATEIIAVQPEYYRAMKAEDLLAEAKGICKGLGVKVLKGGRVSEGIRKALKRADEDSLILCLGSLYMAGEVRNFFFKYHN